MLISQRAIDDYLGRDFKSYRWMKSLTRGQLMDALKDFGVTDRDFKTDPWLHQLVCFYIGLCEPRFLYLMGMGTGKALADDELVLTPTGYVRMDSLKVNDRIIGGDGKATLVTGVYEQGLKQLYRVEFADGASVECCDEHLWSVRKPGRDWKVKELRSFMGNLRGAGGGNRKWFIPMVPPVEFDDDRRLPIDPYLLGLLLGDGSLGNGNCGLSIGRQDADETLRRVRARLPTGVTFRTYTTDKGHLFVSFSGRGGWLRHQLSALGVDAGSHDKFIPSAYLLSSIESRQDLLAGLLDSDGCAYTSGAFEFGVVSKQLALDLQDLVRCLGGSATLGVSRNDFGPVYRVYGRTPHQPFKLGRKVARCSQGKLSPTRGVDSVVPTRVALCRCITVSNPDGLFVARGGVVTHNSKVIMDLLMYRLRQGRTRRALVLMPRLINIDSWLDDLQVHSDLEPNGIITSNTDEKWRLLSDPPRGSDLTLMDYQGFARCVSVKETVQVNKKKTKTIMVPDPDKLAVIRRKYDFVDLDESHRLQAADGLWFGCVNAVADSARYCYANTGTLFAHDPASLWSQFFAVDRGETFGDSLALMRAAFFYEKPAFRGVDYVFDKDKTRLLHRMIGNCSIHYDDEEVQDLPPMQHVRRRLDMDEEQREHYLRALDGLLDARNSGDAQRLETPWVKLRQIVSGYLRWRDEYGEHIVRFKRNPKLLDLERVLDEMGNDSKIVIAYTYTATGQLISDRLSELGIKHEWLYGGTKDKLATRRRFLDDRSVRAMVMQSTAGGEGQNGLQEVARYLYFFESPTSPTTRKQTEKRLRRPGQKFRTYCYDPIIKGGGDLSILEAIEEGRDLYTEVVSGKFKRDLLLR